MKNKHLLKLSLMSLPLLIPVAVIIYIWRNPHVGWSSFSGRGNILIFLVIATTAYCLKLFEEIKDALSWELSSENKLTDVPEEDPQFEIAGNKNTFEYSPVRRIIFGLLTFSISVVTPISLVLYFWEEVLESDLESKIIYISIFCAVVLVGIVLYLAQRFCVESKLVVSDYGVEQFFASGKSVRIAFRDLREVIRDDKNQVYVLKSYREKMVIRKVYQESDSLFELIRNLF